MFARTPRLTLRPGWPEDAPAMAQAVAHESVVTMLSSPPWPYTLGDAENFLSQPRAVTDPYCLILRHESAYPDLIGAISITERGGGNELGYWLTPSAWGRGYATEAGNAMLDMARHALGLKRLRSSYFLDNPASGKVLSKLGFRRTGEKLLYSAARGTEAPCVTMEIDLIVEEQTPTFSLAA
ncbi:GNAT family N-acetyltransferase [Sphingomonas sp. PAMC 26605]|uniref:GNAT family N-acetyltransferase n=1 Tax=Sphingomonas sp. PAMC 26605 TaxID=1112214 RepID=UPI00026CABCB|nr:GNAT family N-acetyltransferase [Sphingomonas sp. PAMC 26605]